MYKLRNLFRYQKSVYESPKRASKHEFEINQQKQRARLMQDKLNQQTSNIENNTPRVISVLFGVLTIPSFYYFYNVLGLDYEDINFFYFSRLSVDWINLKSALYCGTLIGLNMIKYNDFKAKNKLQSKIPINYVFYSLPILFGLISHTCIESLSEWWILPTLGNIIGTLIAFSHATNFGGAPFWTFAIIYQVVVLDLAISGSLLFALRNLNKHREKRTELYIKY